MSIHWATEHNKDCVILTKENGTVLPLKEGDCITYDGRRPDTVRIERFTNGKPDIGPIGVQYLPWRAEEKRWATDRYTMRGNARNLIAYPCGLNHYGEHINWNSVELVENPETKLPPPSGRPLRSCSGRPYLEKEVLDTMPEATCFCSKCHLPRKDSG
jgi:hypothetical protein